MTAALSDDTSQMLLHDESQTRLMDFHWQLGSECLAQIWLFQFLIIWQCLCVPDIYVSQLENWFKMGA